MPHETDFNLWIAEMQLISGVKVRSPLLVPEVTWIGEPEQVLAEAFAVAFQKWYLDKGDYGEVLKHGLPAAPVQRQISVTLEASADGVLYPELDLRFTVLVVELPSGASIGFVPVLGITAVAQSPDLIEKALRDNILLEFARAERLNSVHKILATQWYGELRSVAVPVPLQFHSIQDLRDIRQLKSRKFLPEVADRLQVQRPAAFGMERELEQLTRAFRGRFLQSVLIVGPTGVGKTALVQEFCRSSARSRLQRRTIWETTAARMLQKLVGESGWQNNLAELCREMRERGDILFIRNLADLFEVGQYEGNETSMAESLRDPIQRGEITILTECTREEAAVIETRSQGFLSLFQAIDVAEPDDARLVSIARQKAASLAADQQVTLEPAAIGELVRLQRRYMPYSGYPGKTIQFLESAVSALKPAVSPGESSKARGSRPGAELRLDRDAVVRRFCEESGLPLVIVDPCQPLDLDETDRFFGSNIFGQGEAIKAVIDVLASVKAALARAGKPLASLLFVGPTGVGKTETAKALAQFMFGNRERMIRFDMSEYSGAASVMRLTGERQASEGLLTSAVRQEPFAVLLFDEIEKAHPSFFDLLLQVLGEGRLTDMRGRVADFCGSIIIMTSNIGTATFRKSRTGFVEGSGGAREAVSHFTSAVQDYFRPELFNRLDRIVAFHPLSKATVRDIVDREISMIRKRDGLRFRRVELTVSSPVLDRLSRRGYDARYGARHVQRVVRREFLYPLSGKLNRFPFQTLLTAHVGMVRGGDLPVAGVKQDLRGVLHADAQQRALETLNRMAEGRKEAQRIENGSAFVRLQNRHDSLERLRKKLGMKFWQDQDMASNYKFYGQIVRECERRFREAEDLEIESAASWLCSLSQNVPVQDTWSAWEPSWSKVKMDLYSAMNPTGDACMVGIYGNEDRLSALGDIYTDITAISEFGLQVQALRYIVFRGGECMTVSAKAREKEPGKIVGMELRIGGRCALLYLRGETGFHVWEDERRKKSLYYVLAARVDDFQTPQGVERKHFFTGAEYRRTYSPGLLKDKPYGLEAHGSSHAALLAEALRSRFDENLTAALCESAPGERARLTLRPTEPKAKRR